MIERSQIIPIHFILISSIWSLLFTVCLTSIFQCCCMKQIDGSWKVKNENLFTLYKVAKELKDKFASFQISHVLRVGTVFCFCVYGISFGFILAICRVPQSCKLSKIGEISVLSIAQKM
jgi:hypothetical protein